MYVVGNNNEKYIYNVDFNYELQSWMNDTKLYYTDSIFQDRDDAFIIGLSYTCYTMNKAQVDNNFGVISGTVFEKTEATKYEALVKIKYNGSEVASEQTVNGEFSFNKLNKDLKYNIEFIDTTNKYTSKLLTEIQPVFDESQNPQIVTFFKPVATTKLEYYFGVHAYGEEVNVSLIGAPTLSIVKISDDIYKVVGANSGSTVEFTIQLDDIRNGTKYSVTKEIKSN